MMLQYGRVLTKTSQEFGYGLYDGITGLVTQPLQGAQKGGFGGFLKGVGKGIGGIALKPAAGPYLSAILPYGHVSTDSTVRILGYPWIRITGFLSRNPEPFYEGHCG